MSSPNPLGTMSRVRENDHCDSSELCVDFSVQVLPLTSSDAMFVRVMPADAEMLVVGDKI
jgi:hypothetical protein